MIRALSDALIAVLLAPCCACCGAPLERPTPAARSAPPAGRPSRPAPDPLCETCGDALPSWRQLDLDQAMQSRCRRSRRESSPAADRSVRTKAALRDIAPCAEVRAAGGRVARPLGALMRPRRGGGAGGADLAVPVPLHLFRHIHAAASTRPTELAAHIGLPVVHALRRTRAHRHPDRPSRRANATPTCRDAFRLRRRDSGGSGGRGGG